MIYGVLHHFIIIGVSGIFVLENNNHTVQISNNHDNLQVV